MNFHLPRSGLQEDPTMKYPMLVLLAGALTLGLATDSAQASSAKSKAKAARAMAQTNMDGNQADVKLTKGAKCGVNVGTVTVQKGARAPREVNTTVKGDVISVCK